MYTYSTYGIKLMAAGLFGPLWFDITCRYLWPTLVLAFKIISYFQPPFGAFEMVALNIACIVAAGLGSFGLYIAPIGRKEQHVYGHGQ